MQDFIEILRELIDETGLSLRKLSKESGVTHAQYSRYLHGSVPTIEIIMKIAKYFNCSVDYLFGLSNQKVNKKYTSYDYDISKFVENYEKLLKLNKISHYKFSEQTSFKESIIRHWRNGRIPRMDNIYTIADKLGGSIDVLIGRK